MNILFIGKEDVDLFETLKYSETSRTILRFYEPRRCSCGVCLTTSTLGIALSLVSELRWYVRRYMAEVLFELHEGIYGTHTLAREVYERDLPLHAEGVLRSLYGIQNGKITRIIHLGPEVSRGPPADLVTMDRVLEVWSPAHELPDDETDSIDDTGENH
ncbi:MAG: DUF5804 family protein [Methanomicrobiales archaeon]|nr:DUF5804 family protein [Methanomicrobiales archaeon]